MELTAAAMALESLKADELRKICDTEEAKRVLDDLMHNARNETVKHNSVVTVLKLNGELIDRSENINRNINSDIDLERSANDAIARLMAGKSVSTAPSLTPTNLNT